MEIDTSQTTNRISLLSSTTTATSTNTWWNNNNNNNDNSMNNNGNKETLYKFFIDNDHRVITFLQLTGFSFKRYPGQSLLTFVLIESWVLTVSIMAVIGFFNLMRANHDIFQIHNDNIPGWFLMIFILGSCITVILQIGAISFSLFHCARSLSKPNPTTTINVKDDCLRYSIIFFAATQFLAIGSLILFTVNGNNFGPEINKPYMNIGIGSLNIVLTSYLSVVLFFMTLTIRQTHEAQYDLVKGAENGSVTLENYKYIRKYVVDSTDSSQSASTSVILIAALNVVVYLICIYAIFTEANKSLPDSLQFKASDIGAYSGVFMKEILFFVYILYQSCGINDIHNEFLRILCNQEFDEENKDRKRIGLIIYAMNYPICFKVLGFTVQKFKVLNCLLAFLSISVFYIGTKVYFFYETAIS